MFLAVGALTSQLAATRRQAASYAAAFLGVGYAVRMIADAGVGLHGLIWVSPLGWVEELRPLTAPQPLALLPIVAFTAVLAVAAVGPGRRPRRRGEHRCRTGPAARPQLRLLSGPAGLAIRLVRPTVIGWWVAIARRRRCCSGSSPSRPAARSRDHRRRRCSPSSAHPGRAPTRCSASCFLILAVLVAFVAAGQVTAARSEESAGGSTTSWSARSRVRRWLGGRLAGGRRRPRWRAALAAGVFAWLGAASQHAGVEPGDAARRPASTSSRRPSSSWGIGVLAFGVWPRAHVDRRLRRAGLVAARRHRRRHRRRQPLGARHLGLPSDGVGPGRAAALGSERRHDRHRRRLRPARRRRVQATRPAGQ